MKRPEQQVAALVGGNSLAAIHSLTMLVLYGLLGGFLLGVGQLPVPWQALLLSIGIYVALPLVAGYLSCKWLIAAKGETWFRERFLHLLTPVTIVALLTTLVLLFSFKGDVILSNPLTIVWIAIPLFLQTVLIFAVDPQQLCGSKNGQQARRRRARAGRKGARS